MRAVGDILSKDGIGVGERRRTGVSKLLSIFALAAVAAAALLCVPQDVQAQGPAVVTAYYPPPAVVGYRAHVRGVLFPRVVYRPTVSYVAPAVTTVASPVFVSAPVTTYYAPQPVVSYYTQPVVRVTNYYAPAPVVLPPPVTVRYVPAPVVQYYIGP
jgi:hypothetical protein